jgi:hypothetical protein
MLNLKPGADGGTRDRARQYHLSRRGLAPACSRCATRWRRF